jgi:uncharacterized protein (TIGR00725 family)
MIQIGVIGSGNCSPEIAKVAEEVGERIAKAGAVLVCGGLGGVMEAAARGAKKAGGQTIGILPGFARGEANRYIDFFIITGLSQARNVIVVRSSDAVVAVEGGFGTLSEIALALQIGVPVVGIGTWELKKERGEIKEIKRARIPEEAVEKVIEAARERSGNGR